MIELLVVIAIIAILASLLVALTLTPMLGSRFLKAPHSLRHGWFYNVMEKGFDAWLRGYSWTLRQTIRFKGVTMLVSAALLACAPAGAEETGRSFEIYGFAQADYIQDIGGRLDPDWDDAFRPSKICFDGACGGDGQASVSVKQSRFGVKGTFFKVVEYEVEHTAKGLQAVDVVPLP